MTMYDSDIAIMLMNRWRARVDYSQPDSSTELLLEGGIGFSAFSSPLRFEDGAQVDGIGELERLLFDDGSRAIRLIYATLTFQSTPWVAVAPLQTDYSTPNNRVGTPLCELR